MRENTPLPSSLYSLVMNQGREDPIKHIILEIITLSIASYTLRNAKTKHCNGNKIVLKRHHKIMKNVICV